MTDFIAKEAAEAQYLKDSHVCPFCGGQIVADEMTGDGNCQHSETHCEDCRAEFIETYRLSEVGVLHGPALPVNNVKELKA